MLTLSTVEGAVDWLEQSGSLSEALLTSLHFANFGYSVHVDFRMIVDQGGVLLDDPISVGIDLQGVQKFTLIGGLSARMLERPDEINWGLSEVAKVRASSSEEIIRFEALWEGDRRIEIECSRIALSVSEVTRGVGN